MQFHLFPILILLGKLCNGSLVKCPNPEFDQCGRCTSVNDPHITTFDDVYYDHHQDGCYQYVTQCPKAPNVVPFEICGCHYQCRPVARCIGDVSISFFDAGIETYDIYIDYLNPLAPAINTLGPVPLISGTTYIFNGAGDKFRYTQVANEHIFEIYGTAPYYGYVSYKPGNLRVWLDSDYFVESACGLCGLFDIDPDNDFTGSDNILYVVPADSVFWPILRYGQNGPVLNGKINDFANTYPCTAEGPQDNPDGFQDCYDSAKPCCHNLWTAVLQKMKWRNPIVSPKDFLNNWLEACIGDVCLDKGNEFEICDISEEIYQFSRNILTDTATKTFE